MCESYMLKFWRNDILSDIMQDLGNMEAIYRQFFPEAYLRLLLGAIT